MFSSSPTLTFRLVALSSVVCLGSLIHCSKAFNESFQISPGTSWGVHWMLRYVLDFYCILSPARFASSLGYSQPLWIQSTYLESPQQSASIGAALMSPSAPVALERTMCSSSLT